MPGRWRRMVMWGLGAVTLLLIAVAVATCWWSVYWQGTEVEGVYFEVGCVGVAWGEAKIGSGLSPGWHVEPATGRLWWWVWFDRVGDLRTWVVPLWMPVAACLIPLVVLMRAEIMARRARRVGLCPACGYSRAGLAASAACPECGAGAEGGATGARARESAGATSPGDG